MDRQGTLDRDDSVSAIGTSSNQSMGITPVEMHNFRSYSLYQIFLRTGWIFKTESIIMPAVLDIIGGSGWLRGCLPMLNRFGQSIPPMLASDWVRNSPLKKRGLAMTTALMGCCFLIMAIAWHYTEGRQVAWLPYLFLLIYGIFFAATGINQLQMVTITGKLIRVDYRGRVGMVATLVGSLVACVLAWFLLRTWLPVTAGADSGGNFTAIFGFTGVLFLMAAVLALSFREAAENHPGQESRNGWALLKSSLTAVRDHRNFRRLAIIGALFGMSLTLFPHYQSLARERLSLGLSALVSWVIAQNIGSAVFSIPAGWIADRCGNRLVLRMIMLVMALPPLLSLAVVHWPALGAVWFNLVFFLIGLTPVTFRILFNYTLEVVEPSEHPRYLSTLSLFMAGPAILTSALFGMLIDRVGFEFVFFIVVGCLMLAWLLTFSLSEPRKTIPEIDHSKINQ